MTKVTRFPQLSIAVDLSYSPNMKILGIVAVVFVLAPLVVLSSAAAEPAAKSTIDEVCGFKMGLKPKDLSEAKATGLPNTYSVNGRREADRFGFERYLVKFSSRSGLCAVTAVHNVDSFDEASAFARGVMQTLVTKYGEGTADKSASGNNLLVANWGTMDAPNSIQLVLLKNPSGGKITYLVIVIFCYSNFRDFERDPVG